MIRNLYAFIRILKSFRVLKLEPVFHVLAKYISFVVLDCSGPIHKGKDEEEADSMILAPDLIKIIETSILTFLLFLKMDKKKTSAGLSLFGNQNHATPLQQIQTSLDKVRSMDISCLLSF